MQNLFVIFASQCTFLQSEFTNLLVKSTFDAETSRIYKQFEYNTAAFSDTALRNLRVSVEIAALSSRTSRPSQQQNQRNFRGRGDYSFSYRGNLFNRRGGFPSRGWRGGQQGSSHDIPTHRDDFSGQ